MEKVVVYIHGRGGNVQEAEHYKPIFSDCDVIGFDYRAQTPWEAKKEFPDFFRILKRRYDSISIVANSIGAYFAMSALENFSIKKAYFISPIVDLENVILDEMFALGLDESDSFEDDDMHGTERDMALSALSYVRTHPIRWHVPTEILYAGRDRLTNRKTMQRFVEKTGAHLTVMENGEHWFHTAEQMQFLDDWLRSVK